MTGWYSYDQCELLERQRADLHDEGRYAAAAQVAYALYARAPRDTLAHGRAARNLAAAHNRLGKHFSAWFRALEAVGIHSRGLLAMRGAPEALGERAASSAYLGAVGLMLALAGHENEHSNRPQISEPTLWHARAAMADFGLYRELHDGRPHALELQHLPHISSVESVMGDQAVGQYLAHAAYENANAAKRGVDTAASPEAVRHSAFGALVVATLADIDQGCRGRELYDTVTKIV